MYIEVNNLSFIYSKGLPYETQALSDISFGIEEGDFVALIGCTGSGKTTLSELLVGLEKPSSGSVVVNGIDINDKSSEAKAIKKSLGIVFQYPEYQLFEETVLKDVAFGPKNAGFDEKECDERAREALRLVGITDSEILEKSPFTLSGGQKRRVAIAGVLAMRPKLLVLDEPTAGLDPKGHNDIFDMILRIKEETGMTVVLVSHDMNDVARLSNIVIALKDGRIALIGSPRDVFADKEKLDEAGLSLPNSAKVLDELKDAGFDINTNVLTIEEAADEIVRVFTK